MLQTCERCVTPIKDDLKRTTKRPIRVNSTVKTAMRNESHSKKEQLQKEKRKEHKRQPVKHKP